QRAGSEREHLYPSLRHPVLSGYSPHLPYRQSGSLFRGSIALELAAERFAAASTAALSLPEHRTRSSEAPQSDKLPATLLPPDHGQAVEPVGPALSRGDLGTLS